MSADTKIEPQDFSKKEEEEDDFCEEEENDDDEEDDEEEEDEDDDDEEPKLKYERIGNSFQEILAEDAASCMTVHPKVV